MTKDKYYYRRGGIIGFVFKLAFVFIVLAIAFGMVSIYFKNNADKVDQAEEVIYKLKDAISEGQRVQEEAAQKGAEIIKEVAEPTTSTGTETVTPPTE
jgi:hypothetical protein